MMDDEVRKLKWAKAKVLEACDGLEGVEACEFFGLMAEWCEGESERLMLE